MEVNCEGCAGCCVDWRPVAPGPLDHERRGRERPLDDAYNFVPLTRDEVVDFLDAGFGDALTPRLWRATGATESDAHGDPSTPVTSSRPSGRESRTVEIDGVDVVALRARPVFFVGLRSIPKPVSPFGVVWTWLSACAFLDPDTLQCRIHGGELYPSDCADYPGHNLVLGRETECERVESAFDAPGERLRDGDPPDRPGRLLLGPHALGSRVFVHPDPDRLDGTVRRLVAGRPTRADRAEFVGVAAGAHPGSDEIDGTRAEAARERALDAESWVSEAAVEWARAAAAEVGSDAIGASIGEDAKDAPIGEDAKDAPTGEDAKDAPTGEDVEVSIGAPPTPGW